MSNGDPVTHAELNKIITSNTDRVLSKMDRVEDRLSANIIDVRTGCKEDNDEVGDRVTKLEDYNRKQNIFGVVFGAVVAALVTIFKGG